LREKLYGEQATRNHQGSAFTAGQITGGVASLATGVGTPANFAKGLGWAQKAAIGYDVAATGYGAYDATTKLQQGCATPLDALNFLPAVGYGASRLNRVAHGLDDAAPGAANFMSNKDHFFINSGKRPDIDPDGFFDITLHGTPSQVQVNTPNGDIMINHRVLSKLIQQQEGYNGQNIRLLSCSTGACTNGLAQNLANKLDKTVRAPSDTLWAYPNGKLTIGSTPRSNTGQWIDFNPQKSNQ